MNRTHELLALADRYGAHNYKPLPVFLVRGEGAWVWDVEGKKYLDMLAAYSALNFGHSHPDLVRVLASQAQKLSLCSRAFQSEELAHFCHALSDFCEMECALPMNSGTEAVETALKLVRKWGHLKKRLAPEKSQILAMENNFHGRSITIVSFSSEPIYRNGFGPYTPGFGLVPFGDPLALKKAMTTETLAVLVEPIQAEAGILIPPKGYLNEVRKICNDYGALLILDEIQTGLGRTGRNFCWQHENAKPDILILGKSLGGGLIPVSAVVTRREIMDVIQPGEHGSTFGGNPLACAIGRKALTLLKELGLSEKAAAIGTEVKRLLGSLKSPVVKEIRGRGALIGIELFPEAGGARKYCERLLERGVLCKETHDHVIRIAPPLTISMEDLRWGTGQIMEVLRT